MQPTKAKRSLRRVLRAALLAFSCVTLYYSLIHGALLLEILLRPTSATSQDDQAFKDTLLAETAAATINNDFDRLIHEAINSDDIVLAEIYIDLADLLQRPATPETLAYYRQNITPWESSLRTARVCWDGALRTGEVSLTALSCQVATDVIGVGDALDVGRQSLNYLEDKPVDTVILGLSLAGLATTVAMYGSAGTAAPLDAGVSAVKAGVKSGRIGAKLSGQISEQFVKILDRAALKQAWRQKPVATIGKELKAGKYFNKTAYKASMNVLDDLGTIHTQGRGLSTAMLALKHSNNVADIATYRRVTKVFGKNADGVITVLGKSTVKIAKASGKVTLKLAVKLGGLALTTLLALAGIALSLLGSVGSWAGKRALKYQLKRL